MHDEGRYKYPGVKRADGSEVSFKDWAGLVNGNFERCYYIPTSAGEDGEFDVKTQIVNRRGIYKDVYRSGKPYEDYQLRPNFPIAMSVAPDLFTPDRALRALSMADKVLRGPTGMATLDPADLNYRPYYVNSEDSDDFATAKGRNYHQGPEWLWPTGFFLRALLRFDLKRRGDGGDGQERVEAFQQVTRRLAGCKGMIKGEWAGLAELTQKDGEFCPDSVSFFFIPFFHPYPGGCGFCSLRIVISAGVERLLTECSLPHRRGRRDALLTFTWTLRRRREGLPRRMFLLGASFLPNGGNGGMRGEAGGWLAEKRGVWES